jgi:transposase-like protein
MLSERGVVISHTTILRRVVHYAEACEKRWQRSKSRGWKLACGGDIHQGSRAMDVFVPAVDGHGDTVDFYLSGRRDRKAAKAFLKPDLPCRHSRSASRR